MVTSVTNMETTRDTQTDAYTVAKNIERGMKAAGYNPNSFSRATGIARSSLIRHLEGNEPGFGLSQIAKIASVLGVSSASLYPRADASPEREVSHV
jgi:hypothetical protein